jgi:hypothetical protein
MLNALSIFATATCDKSGDFLGLLPWWNYLPASDFDATCTIKKFNLLHGQSEVPLVLLAVVDDLLRIAGLVAVGFIISAAFKFITSQGDPEGTARARQTVINALVGLAVAIVSVVFVSFIGNTLGNGS